ncbi:MAG: hypothetical protein JSV08_08510 [Acidobacteriota bacterium]|nr:MAG: hypothetical protein JSV08_08510 [Acidobacteriota bacterium]
MKMKLLLTAALGVAAGALLAGLMLTPAPAFAATGDILTNAANMHNFATSATHDTKSDTTRRCDFCHFPHADGTLLGAAGKTIALWNRKDPAGPFVPYGNPQNTINASNLDATLGGQTLACMSCHDGSLGLDELVVFPAVFPLGGKDILFTSGAGNVGPSGDYEVLIKGTALLGKDLTYDHPVGMEMVLPAVDDGLKDRTTVPTGYLFGATYEVECASCHNPHLYGAGDTLPFLRNTMADSALCGVCHNK